MQRWQLQMQERAQSTESFSSKFSILVWEKGVPTLCIVNEDLVIHDPRSSWRQDTGSSEIADAK